MYSEKQQIHALLKRRRKRASAKCAFKKDLLLNKGNISGVSLLTVFLMVSVGTWRL